MFEAVETMKFPEKHGLNESRSEDDSTSDSDMLFKDDNFEVTNEFVRYGDKTWPVSTIVKVTDHKKPFGVVESLAIGVALLFALYAIFQHTLIWIATGLIIAVFCAKYVRNVFKNQYVVCLQFTSGNKEEILLTQQGVAFRLRNTIRAAMADS